MQAVGSVVFKEDKMEVARLVMFYDDAISWSAKLRGTHKASHDALAPMGAQGESCWGTEYQSGDVLWNAGNGEILCAI